ncbi:MAG: hypothetical protein LBU77_00540, partial [Clostridiales bacterium]|nr:hypothetical protein [Clostridiales bacterium]
LPFKFYLSFQLGFVSHESQLKRESPRYAAPRRETAVSLRGVMTILMPSGLIPRPSGGEATQGFKVFILRRFAAE